MMNGSVVLLQPENEMVLEIGTEIVNGRLVPGADQEARQVDAGAALKDLPVLSISIAMYLVLREAEAVGGKARRLEVRRASEIGVVAETGTGTEIEIETRIGILDALGMRRSPVVGAGLEAEVVGEIGIGRRQGAEVAVPM